MALFFLVVAGFIGATAALDAGPNGNYTGSCALHPSKYLDHSITCIPDHVKSYKSGDRFTLTYFGELANLNRIQWAFALWSANFELLLLARFENNNLYLLSNPSKWAADQRSMITHQTVRFVLPPGRNVRIYMDHTSIGIAFYSLYGNDLNFVRGRTKPFAVFPHQTPRPDSDYKYFSVSKPSQIAPSKFSIHYDDAVFANQNGNRPEYYYEEILYSDKPASFV